MANGLLAGAKDNFGFGIRNKLHVGEDKFFKENPNVAGMAASDNKIILNPYSNETINKAAVAKNEGFRLFLRNKKIPLNFNITEEQRKAFKGTIYENNTQALRETILARMVSGDPSAGVTTDEQKEVLRTLQVGSTQKERNEMPQHTFDPQAELLRLIQQQSQSQAQRPALNTGLLSAGQQGVGDVLTNPDQAQMNALLGAAAGFINPSQGQPGLTAAANALTAFGGQREREFNLGLKAQEFQRESLKDRIAGVTSLAGVQQAQATETRLGNQFTEQKRQFGVTSGQAGAKRESVDLLDRQGNFVATAIQGPRGQLFQFNERGEPEDVSATVQQSGLRVAPAGRSQTTFSNIGNTSDNRESLEFGADLEQKNLLRTKATAGRDKVSLAKRIKELVNAGGTTGVGVETFTDLKSLLRSGLELAGATDLATQLDDISDVETLRGFSGVAMMPYIEAQGRSFSDADRKATAKILPGVMNSPKGNIALANVMQAGGLGDQDEFNFFEARLDAVRNDPGVKTTSGSTSAFNAYVDDLPRLKTVVDADGDTVLEMVDDGRDLWRYYMGGRPKNFITANGNKVTVKDMKETAEAEGMTYRELLGKLDSLGQIVGTE